MTNYRRRIRNAKGQEITADLYDVMHAYGVTNQATGHAIKKLMMAGKRGGGKSVKRDLEEAITAIKRAIQLETPKGKKR
ncbi:MAG TPA: hypothetical protein VFE62_20920 [Gemmataceae bacterium]|nr:hypothetical protein [Gemmataceae bacterium]